MTLEERFEQLMKANAKNDTISQLEHLRRQLKQVMRNSCREIQSSHETSESNLVEDGSKSNPFATSEANDDR